MWKKIKGYEDFYEVNNNGVIRSLDRMVWGGKVFYLKKGKVLKFQTNNKGYYTVCLCGKFEKKIYLVHRIVAEAFVEGKSDANKFVDHIDGNKKNNNYNNLRWVTHKENCNNKNTKCFGEKQSMFGKVFSYEHRKKMSEARGKKVVCINTMEEFDSVTKASEIKGVDAGGISKCCNGKQTSAGKDFESGERRVRGYKDDFKKMNKYDINNLIEKSKTSRKNSLNNLNNYIKR